MRIKFHYSAVLITVKENQLYRFISQGTSAGTILQMNTQLQFTLFSCYNMTVW